MKTLIPVDGQWGIELTSYKAAIEVNLKNLKYYKEVNKVQHKDLEVDIRGYEMILDSNDPEGNAKAFFSIKHHAHISKDLKTNIDVITYMKKHGLWNE
jgi:hypothetical protein